MKKSAFLILTLLLLLNIAFSQITANYAQDQLIVKFKSETHFVFNGSQVELGIPALDAMNQSHSIEKISLTGNKKEGKTFVLKFQQNVNVMEMVEAYSQTDLFEYVEPNFIGRGAGRKGTAATFPNDNLFSRQYGLYNDASFTLSPSTTDADVDMELAWDIEQGDSTIIVAVLDAGARMNHPEFAGRIWTNHDESNNGVDSDTNGYIDDQVGWDFANDDKDPTDDHGHGTNVAGIVGANANNNIGYAGVDWHCKLMMLKILDSSNFGLYSWWAEAIHYAVDNGAKVLNMSVGGSGNSSTLEDAVNYAYNNGVTVVVCMMNEDGIDPFYPAAFQNTIAVGSTNPDDTRSTPFFWSSTSGSNFGSHIDVVAPGNYVYGLDYQSNTNYNTYWGGTSQATPLVAGLSSLLLAQDTSRTPDDIRMILRSTAEDQVGNLMEDSLGFDIFYGYGRVNAHQALMQISAGIEGNFSGELKSFIHPNPANDILSVALEHKDQTIKLINVTGKIVFEKRIQPGNPSLTIDVSKFPSGIYTAQLFQHETKKFYSQKVIIR